MRFYNKQRRIPVINIVSMIDILCIVLIFFIVTTTFRKEEPMIKIDLPESTQAKPAQDPPPVIISVTPDGKIYLGSVPITEDELAEELKDRRSDNVNAKFALKASKQAPFGVIIKVMDAVRGAGFETLPTFTDETTPGQESSGTP